MKGKFITTSLVLAVKSITMEKSRKEIIHTKNELNAYTNVWHKGLSDTIDLIPEFNNITKLKSAVA